MRKLGWTMPCTGGYSGTESDSDDYDDKQDPRGFTRSKVWDDFEDVGLTQGPEAMAALAKNATTESFKDDSNSDYDSDGGLARRMRKRL